MTLINSLRHHAIPVLIFLVLGAVYFAPTFSGEVLLQSDNIQLKGVNKEVTEYREKGESIHWNNREFSGVPLQSPSSLNPFYTAYKFFYLGFFPRLVMMIFALFIGCYILLQVLGVSRWMSTIGSIAFAFSTFNIISIEVGHDYKVLAMAFMAPVLAGVIAAYRGAYLKGGLLTFLAAGFQLYFGHIQITYYLLWMVLGYVILVLVETVRNKSWKHFFQASAVLTLATALAFGSNFGKLYSILEYSDYSTRGGSELTKGQSANVSNDGLDKDYALSWSSGKLEALTLIFPYFHGGASSESLDESSDTYQALTTRGVDKRTIDSVTNNLPLYWGTQPFTGGPIYFGAILGFLFIFGLLIIKEPVKWWALGLTVLSLFLAMGKNLEWFTDMFFYYVPLYNKFRSVTMILSIAQLTIPVLGIMALDKVFKEEFEAKELVQKLFQAAGIVIGVGMVFILFKASFFDFKGQNDAAYGFPQWLVDALVSDRKRLFTNDIIRSIVFVGLAAGSVWLYLKKIIKPFHAILAIAVLVLVDLWVVDKRYLGGDDFQPKRKITQTQFQPSQADLQIKQDKGHYRVLNLTSQNPFSDGITSYHHYSVLGYSAIKMQRYQELIDRYLREMNTSILSMLNVKYMIIKGQNGHQAQRNSTLGNAWLVNQLKMVSDADDEIERVGIEDLSTTAIFDQRFEALESDYSGNGSIDLVDYHPEKMVYNFSSEEEQFAVFSEIFYAPGWNAYIDGEEVDHIRVNYILRGLEIQAGDHEIIFKYEPASIAVGNYLIVISGVLFLILLGGGYYYSRKSVEVQEAEFS